MGKGRVHIWRFERKQTPKPYKFRYIYTASTKRYQWQNSY